MKKIFILLSCVIILLQSSYSEDWKFYSNNMLKIDTLLSLRDLAVDTLGNVWVLSSKSDLVCIKDSTVIKFDDELKLVLADPYDIEINENNNILIHGRTNYATIANNEVHSYGQPLIKNVSLYFWWKFILVGQTAWFTSKYGLHKLSNISDFNSWTLYDSTNSIMKHGQCFSVAVDRNGSICVPNGNGLVKIANNNWSRELFNNINDLYIDGKNVLDYSNSIVFDNNNKLWIATYDYGLFKYENPNWIRYSYTPPIFNSSRVIDIKCDNNGNLWLASDNLVKFDGTSFSRVMHPTKNYLSPYRIIIDKNNTIWLIGGGNNGGLFCYNENGIPTTKNEEKIKKSEFIFYPNPVDKYFNMSFEIKHNANLVIEIYDIAGNKIATALNEHKPIGTTEFNYDVSKLQNGTYILKLTNGPWSESIKFVVNR